MKNHTVRERPFEYLRRREDGTAFPESTVRNWYLARAYVLDRLRDITFGPSSGGHLHAVVNGDSPLMLSVARQLALSAHYANFVEYDALDRLVCRNRSVITLVSRKPADPILSELSQEAYLGHLPDYCRLSVYGALRNADSFIDLELEIVSRQDREEGCLWIDEEDVTAFAASRPAEEIYSIDTRKAVRAGETYRLGAVIDNIPYESIHSPGRYSDALDTFQYRVLQEKKDGTLITPAWERDPVAVTNGLSNIICTDCFASRALAILRQYPEGKKPDRRIMKAVWEKNCQALSLSEHSRWVVEKLVMGFRPLSEEQRKAYASLFGERRTAFLQRLKCDPAAPAHLDICSYRELRRVDPDKLKYDSFLMLAIPLILGKDE